MDIMKESWAWQEDPTSPGYFPVNSVSGVNICMLQQSDSDMGSDSDPSRAEAIAIANAIAAAPDMLAALKDAMRSTRKDFKHGPDGDRQHREAYAEQFAAIAKAEGRAIGENK